MQEGPSNIIVISEKTSQYVQQGTFKPYQRIIYLFASIIHSIFLLFFSIYLYIYLSQFSYSEQQLQNLIQNWQKSPIINIKVIIPTVEDIKNKIVLECPENYEYLFKLKIPQIQEGCICNNEIFVQKCENLQGNIGNCKKISEIQEKHIYYLKTPSNTLFSVCIQRQNDINFKNIHQLCNNCAINYISFEENASISDQTQLKIDSSLSLFYSKNTNEVPIVETQVSEGIGVCLDNNVSNVDQNKQVYPLMSKYSFNQCKQIDKRYVKIYQNNEFDVFKTNFVYDEYRNLPQFQINNSVFYSYFFRRYIFNSQCQQNVSEKNEIIENYNNLENIQSVSMIFLVLAIFYIIFCGFIYNVFSILDILNKKYAQKCGQNPKISDIQSTFIWKKIGVKFVFSLLLSIILIVLFVNLKKLDNFYQKFKSLKCLDIITQNIFENLYQENQKNAVFLAYFQVIFSFLLFTIDLIIFTKILSIKMKQKVILEISKKYQQKSPEKKAENTEKQELPEYQAYNIYAGNGINTTLNNATQTVNKNQQSYFSHNAGPNYNLNITSDKNNCKQIVVGEDNTPNNDTEKQNGNSFFQNNASIQNNASMFQNNATYIQNKNASFQQNNISNIQNATQVNNNNASCVSALQNLQQNNISFNQKSDHFNQFDEEMQEQNEIKREEGLEIRQDEIVEKNSIFEKNYQQIQQIQQSYQQIQQRNQDMIAQNHQKCQTEDFQKQDNLIRQIQHDQQILNMSLNNYKENRNCAQFKQNNEQLQYYIQQNQLNSQAILQNKQSNNDAQINNNTQVDLQKNRQNDATVFNQPIQYNYIKKEN